MVDFTTNFLDFGWVRAEILKFVINFRTVNVENDRLVPSPLQSAIISEIALILLISVGRFMSIIFAVKFTALFPDISSLFKKILQY